MRNWNSSKNQRIKHKFVEREVYYCQSYLVEDLLSVNPDLFDEIINLYIYTEELLDGWFSGDEEEKEEKIEEIEKEMEEIEKEMEEINEINEINELKERITELDEDIGILEHAESEPQEIHEWWLVSDWLADKLERKGEPILREYNCVWWGRCTSGQAILLDGVISEICDDMKILEGQKNEW